MIGQASAVWSDDHWYFLIIAINKVYTGSGARIRTWEMAVPKTAALPLGYARSLSAYSIVSMLRLYHAARVLTRCRIHSRKMLLKQVHFTLLKNTAQAAGLS